MDTGLRRRTGRIATGDADGGAPRQPQHHSPLKSPDVHFDPGFNSEDYEKDTEADSQSEPGSELEPGSDDDGNSDADSQYDSQNDSDDGEPHVGTAQNTRIASYQDDHDAATADVLMGIIGFLLFSLATTVLPVLGVDRTIVIVAGMVAVIGTVLLYTFFPPKVAPGERTSYAALIFMIGAGIGTMIGGMLGTVLRVHLKMWDREAQLAHPAL